MTAEDVLREGRPRPLACTGVTFVSADLDEDRRLRFLAECDAEPPLGDCGWVVDLDREGVDGKFGALNNLSMTLLHQRHLDHSAKRNEATS